MAAVEKKNNRRGEALECFTRGFRTDIRAYVALDVVAVRRGKVLVADKAGKIQEGMARLEARVSHVQLMAERNVGRSKKYIFIL